MTATIIKSSTDAIESAKRVWRLMVDVVNDCFPHHGRGCMYYCKSTGAFGYVALSKLIEEGPEGSDLNPDIHAQLVHELQNYDTEREFILLAQHDHSDHEKYVVQVCTLDYDAWHEVKDADEIKAQERMTQLEYARQVRGIMQRQRKGKKGKRK